MCEALSIWIVKNTEELLYNVTSEDWKKVLL